MARHEFQLVPTLDPDAVAKSIQELVPGSHSDIAAGKKVLRLAEDFLEARQSFTVETTLLGKSYLRLAARAKQKRFVVVGVFIGTDSVEINIERVSVRVRKGGHDVSEEDQRRRYSRTLENMRRLLPLCDFAVILDNSSHQEHTLVGFGQSEELVWLNVPAWATTLRNISP